MTEQEFGRRLHSLRTQLGLTQLELSLRCGIQASFIGSLELGKKNPTLTTITKIADGLGISITELLGDTEPSIKKGDPLIDKAVSYLMPLGEEKQRHIVDIIKIAAKIQ